MSRIPINDDNPSDPNSPAEPDVDPMDSELEDETEEMESQAASATPDSPQGRQAPGGEAAAPSDAELQRLQEERDALFDRLARATADFRNAQKRLQSELEQRVQYANSSLIKSLLPVIDNFERALAVDPATTDVPSLLRGMQIVHDQWLKVLKDQTVEEIAPAPGTPFDPTKHEAMMQQESEYTEPAVVQLLQKGYALHGRTLRPAKVIVSKTS